MASGSSAGGRWPHAGHHVQPGAGDAASAAVPAARSGATTASCSPGDDQHRDRDRVEQPVAYVEVGQRLAGQRVGLVVDLAQPRAAARWPVRGVALEEAGGEPAAGRARDHRRRPGAAHQRGALVPGGGLADPRLRRRGTRPGRDRARVRGQQRGRPRRRATPRRTTLGARRPAPPARRPDDVGEVGDGERPGRGRRCGRGRAGPSRRPRTGQPSRRTAALPERLDRRCRATGRRRAAAPAAADPASRVRSGRVSHGRPPRVAGPGKERVDELRRPRRGSRRRLPALAALGEQGVGRLLGARAPSRRDRPPARRPARRPATRRSPPAPAAGAAPATRRARRRRDVRRRPARRRGGAARRAGAPAARRCGPAPRAPGCACGASSTSRPVRRRTLAQLARSRAGPSSSDVRGHRAQRVAAWSTSASPIRVTAARRVCHGAPGQRSPSSSAKAQRRPPGRRRASARPTQREGARGAAALHGQLGRRSRRRCRTASSDRRPATARP